jgi:uncharacterized protein YjiS (DUF1127 family)
MLRRLGAALRRLAAARRVWVARWASRRAIDRAASEIAGLDAQTLRDIGIARSEAHSAALEAAGQIESTRTPAQRRSEVTAPSEDNLAKVMS